jgi:hypothetical protein
MSPPVEFWRMLGPLTETLEQLAWKHLRRKASPGSQWRLRCPNAALQPAPVVKGRSGVFFWLQFLGVMVDMDLRYSVLHKTWR